MSPNRGISQKARVRGPTVCAASPELSVRCVLSYSQKMQSSCDRIYLQNRIQSHFVMNGNYLLLDAKIQINSINIAYEALTNSKKC